MTNYQQPDPYKHLQHWHQMQQHMKNQQAQQQQQHQHHLLEQQGYVKKKNCNCSGKKQIFSDQQNQG